MKKQKEDVNMNVDEVIELENGHNYLLLLKSILDGSNYFLAVRIENNEPTNEYKVLKEYLENGELYIQEVKNPITLNKLLDEYSIKYYEEFKE